MLLEKNSKIAILAVTLLIAMIVFILGYTLVKHNNLSDENRRLKTQISRVISANTPKEKELLERQRKMSVMISAMTHINNLSTLAESFISPASNMSQMHILQLARDKKLAIRNYSPKLNNIALGSSVYNGCTILFTAHGDFIPTLEFISELENTLPLCKIVKITMQPEAAVGGKLKTNFKLFLPNFKQK